MTVYGIGRTTDGDLDLERVERCWTLPDGSVYKAIYDVHEWVSGGPTGRGTCDGTIPQAMVFTEGYRLLGERAHRRLAWTPLKCGKLVRIDSTSAAEAQAPTGPAAANATSAAGGGEVRPENDDGNATLSGGGWALVVLPVVVLGIAGAAAASRREKRHVVDGDEESRGAESSEMGLPDRAPALK